MKPSKSSANIHGWFVWSLSALVTGVVFAVAARAGDAQAKTGASLQTQPWRRTAGAPAGYEYIGSSACATCHRSIADTQPRTPMARAALAPLQNTALMKNSALAYQDGPYLLRIERRGDEVIYSASDGKQTISVPLLWAFGLGNAGQTYIFQRDGTYFESRVSYYNEIDGLDLTMGHSRQPHLSLAEVLGRPLSKDELKKCLSCHTSEDLFEGKLDVTHLHPGVSCENCHGPGSRHLETMQFARATPSEANIFNPGRLGPADLNDFCGTCHRSTRDVLASKVRGILNLRFQPYRLENSRCYDPTDKRISCLACHDPHVDLAVDAANYDSKCLACHAKGKKSAARRPAQACLAGAGNCVDCHMPKLPLPGAHFKFTDHYIRIYRPDQSYPD